MERGRRSRLYTAKPSIVDFFESAPQNVYLPTELARILAANRNEWRLPARTTPTQFLSFLCDETALHEVRVVSANHPNVRALKRYTWATVSPLHIALSLKRNSYLSHGTAAYLHHLRDEPLPVIHLNQEQSPKNVPTNVVTQEGLNRAFRGKQRQSTFVFRVDDRRVVLINGKHSQNLEVGPVIFNGEAFNATQLERTLIDITVRPMYAGGALPVLEAYRRARLSVSIPKLMGILTKLDYVYPYHQAVGFYMTRAGYDAALCQQLKRPEPRLDFYLAHNLENPPYDQEWRIYYPGRTRGNGNRTRRVTSTGQVAK